MQNNCQNTNWPVFKHFNSEKKEPKSHKKTKQTCVSHKHMYSKMTYCHHYPAFRLNFIKNLITFVSVSQSVMKIQMRNL